MDTTLFIAALVVVLVLGSLAVLALLIGYIVRVCVGKAQPRDMPVIIERIIGLIGALEMFTPRHQGLEQLTTLGALQLGQPGGRSVPPAVPGQLVEGSAPLQGAGDAR